MKLSFWHLGIILFFQILLITSCSSTRKTKYFQDIRDTGLLANIPKSEYKEPLIQSDDILTITIQAVDPQASALLNPSVTTQNTVAGITSIQAPYLNSPGSYLVDKDGLVNLPVVGKVKVVGLTTAQAKETIFKQADLYYKQLSVLVRFANFRINVGGEVARPGTYVMANEKVSILDALSLAGDLTIFGRRDNVLLIRENLDGSKTPVRINLKKVEFMSSPYFYLKQNDYLYVEPDKGKAAATDAAAARNYTIAGSILSIIAIVLTRR